MASFRINRPSFRTFKGVSFLYEYAVGIQRMIQRTNAASAVTMRHFAYGLRETRS
jgi:hypothetical protein